MQNFRGILFTLKKRMQNPSKDDHDRYDYLTFGYYDGLDIRCIDKWYDYRPKGLMNKNLVLKMHDEFIDLYTVKALFPKNVSELEEQGFSYTPFVNQEEINFPFMAMSLINISEEFVDQYLGYEALNKQVYNYVKEVLEEDKNANLQCTIFPSIGYSDYIIVYFSNGFSKIAAAIDKLRKKRLSNKYIAFSSCYTVCGINTKWNGSGSILKEDVKLSIRINLKSGKSSDEFISEFKSRAKDVFRSKGMSEDEINRIEADWEQCFHTFGNSDSLLIPDRHLKTYLPLYMKNELLNPESDFFKSYITNINSSIRVKKEGISQGVSFEESNDAKKQRIRERWDEFKDFIKEFDEFIDENNLHKRLLKSLEQLMKNYLNLAQLQHCFDVEIIIGEIFDALINNLRYVMKNYPNKNEEIDLSRVIESLNEFREIMRVYITDMIHSDKLFIEGQTLTHPSVGSATKLLFAYNSMMTDLMNRMRDSEKAEAVSEFRLLVTSGGCDRTNVRDVFNCLGNHRECPKILIATIPEISLYDIKGTTFRLFHECMHFCGKRHRKERLEFLWNAIGNFISYNIVTLLYSQESFELYFSEISTYFANNLSELQRVKDEVYVIYEQSSENLRHGIYQLIVQDSYILEYLRDNGDELSCYLSSLEAGLLSAQEISKLFLSDFSKKDTLCNNMYECLSNGQMEFFEKMSSYARSKKIYYTGFDSYIQHKNYLKDKGRQESEIICFLNEYFQEFMQQLSNGELSKINNSEDIIKYDELVEALGGSLKEGFADCFAIKVLKMHYVDFLLGFIYEEWNMELALPDYLLNIMRIGADLSVMYGIEEILSEEQEKEIRDKVKHWEEQGYQYQNVAQLINRTNSILSDYHRLKMNGLTGEIEDYLKMCVEDNAFPECTDFANFHINCDFNVEQDVYQVMEYLTCKWEGLKNANR